MVQEFFTKSSPFLMLPSSSGISYNMYNRRPAKLCEFCQILHMTPYAVVPSKLSFMGEIDKHLIVIPKVKASQVNINSGELGMQMR